MKCEHGDRIGPMCGTCGRILSLATVVAVGPDDDHDPFDDPDYIPPGEHDFDDDENDEDWPDDSDIDWSPGGDDSDIDDEPDLDDSELDAANAWIDEIGSNCTSVNGLAPFM